VPEPYQENWAISHNNGISNRTTIINHSHKSR